MRAVLQVLAAPQPSGIAQASPSATPDSHVVERCEAGLAQTGESIDALFIMKDWQDRFGDNSAAAGGIVLLLYPPFLVTKTESGSILCVRDFVPIV